MLDDLRYRLRAVFRRRAVERELDEELRFHLDHQRDKYLAGGMTPDEAARRVRLDFGTTDAIKEDCRDARGVRAVDEVDLRVGNWGWRWVACARSERGRESSGWEETWGGHLRHEDDTVT